MHASLRKASIFSSRGQHLCQVERINNFELFYSPPGCLYTTKTRVSFSNLECSFALHHSHQ
ncbi:unnamed protein product [Rodentolepis nana]|uniref:Uncharacterized protein n=1 Tax=Rodentolepis nana TaxID=102285 RepID=A0A3P7S2U4_RODNA|nr:unnamed protein product [Rodentolepis nana]